jgi:hypothetical protein
LGERGKDKKNSNKAKMNKKTKQKKKPEIQKATRGNSFRDHYVDQVNTGINILRP